MRFSLSKRSNNCLRLSGNFPWNDRSNHFRVNQTHQRMWAHFRFLALPFLFKIRSCLPKREATITSWQLVLVLVATGWYYSHRSKVVLLLDQEIQKCWVHLCNNKWTARQQGGAKAWHSQTIKLLNWTDVTNWYKCNARSHNETRIDA